MTTWTDDEAGGTVWSEDEAAGTALGAANGSSLVGFVQSGSATVARTAQAKMREVAYSPEDTGATGDGVADDKAEIDQAVTNLTSTGGVVDLSAKTYYCATKLTAIPAAVNFRGRGAAHHAFYDAGTTAGTVLLIQGGANDDLLTLGNAANRGMFGLQDLSVYSSGTAAIRSIVRIAGVLHPVIRSVEIAGLDDTDGVGLDLARDGSGNPCLYGDFFHLKIVNVDTGLRIDGDCNANTFHGGSIQGVVRSFLIAATAATPNANTFNGTSFETVYSTSMEHEYIAPGTHIHGVGRNSAGVYVVKLGKLTGADSTTFNGCYFEVGSVPSTYDDGSNGTLNLYPVIEVGSGVTNTQFNNCEWGVYLLDRGTRTRANNLIANSDYWTKAPPRSIRRTNTATSISATSLTAIPFATALEEDTGSFYWDSGNTRLEVLRAGFYRISVQVTTENWGAAQAWGYLKITAGGQVFIGQNHPPDASGNQIGHVCEAALSLAVGNTIKVEAFMGEDVTVVADLTYNRLMVWQC